MTRLIPGLVAFGLAAAILVAQPPREERSGAGGPRIMVSDPVRLVAADAKTPFVLEVPFAGNMTAWLRNGYLDRAGKLVDQDRFVADNVVVSLTDKYLVIKSKNLPNHPTAVFPDRWRLLDGNPNYIQEQDFTWFIPLEPKENPSHVAMDELNKNQALPGGPIGVSINGIIFHDPTLFRQ